MKTLRTPISRFLLLALLLISATGCQLTTPSDGEPAETKAHVIATQPVATTQPAAATQPADLPAPASPTVMSDLPTPGEELVKETPPSAKDPFPIHTVVPPNDPVPASPALQSIDNLLALTSIKIQLNLDWTDGSMRRSTAEIDARGSLHLAEQSENSPGIYPEMPDIALMSATRETFRVDGKLYRQDGEKGDWTALEGEPDPLARLLKGSTGPGLWLSLLPDSALTPAGEETVGGFNAEKYAVSGNIEDSSVLGAVWIDKETRALVKAELTIPGRLLAAPSAADPGEMSIKLSVEKAQVAEIKAP